MDHTVRLTRQYLDTLSTAELLNLADALALDIPPDQDRIFIIEELLDLENEFDSEEEDNAPLKEGKGVLYQALLPKQYNITFIKVILRDPAWAFVYWEIKGQDKELYEKAADFGGYYLMVSPVESRRESALYTDKQDLASKLEHTFVVPVEPTDIAWYLNIPPDESWYQVDICALKAQEPQILASSRHFRVPKMHNPFAEEYRKNRMTSILGLSGLEESRILYNADRSFRVPKPRGY